MKLAEALRELEASRREAASLRALVETLQQTLAAQRAAFEDQKVALEKVLAELQRNQRRAFGRTSEKMPSPKEAIAKVDGANADPEATQKKRKSRARQRDEIAQRKDIPVPVTAERRRCPHCGGQAKKCV